MHDIVRTFRLVTLMALAIGGTAAADDLTDTLQAESNPGPTRYDLSDLVQPPVAGTSTELRESFALFAEALANKSHSEAEISAKHMVELVAADNNASDIEAAHARARALQNLAIAQQMSGSHESARQNYEAAIDQIVNTDNNLSPALIAPLRGLAIVHLDAGRTSEAFEVFDRATHVSNVNFGPHSLKQLPIINTKMEIYLERNDFASALDMLERTYMLYRREYPRDSLELLPAVYMQSEVYKRLGMYGEERHALRHVLEIKEKNYGKDDPALIEPHMRVAENLVRAMLRDDFRSVTSSTAERHLKKALAIAENSPEEEWEIRKDCLLSLADFYTLFDLKGRARRYYSEAWELMSSNESYLASRAEDLEAPVPLARPEPDLYANFEYNPERDELGPDDYLEGEVVLAFTVNDRGRTEDLRIVKADPENFTEMEARLRNAVKEFAYRPRLANGTPIATPDMQHRFKYFYTTTEYQASLDKATRPRSPWQSRKP